MGGAERKEILISNLGGGSIVKMNVERKFRSALGIAQKNKKPDFFSIMQFCERVCGIKIGFHRKEALVKIVIFIYL